MVGSVVMAAATAGARLELDGWMGPPQRVEQAVQRSGLGMGTRRTVFVRSLHVIPVHVPLDEGDVVNTQQRIERVMDVFECVGAAEVAHELMAPENRFVPLGRQRPVGMPAQQVTVGVDHLRLDPDPELHAERRDVVDPPRRDDTRWTSR